MTKLAIIGCGGEAHGHAQTLRQIPDVDVIGLVSPTAAHREKFREEFFPGAREYAEYEDLLTDPPEGLDAVLLLTPHALHYPQAKAAMEAGYHVLTEKPMVTSAAHAFELWRLEKATGKHIGITFQAPYSAPFQYLRQLREQNQWGRVQLIQGWLAQGWMQSTLLTWRQDPTLAGGGQLYDSGSHVLNSMLWLMDEPVTEVTCLLDNCGTPVDINGCAILRFASGAMGSIAIGGNSPGWDVRLSIQTDLMQIHTDPHGEAIEFRNYPESFHPSVPTDPTPAAFSAHRNFINALHGREELQVTVRHGVSLSVVMDAMYESARTNAVVKVPPVPDEPPDPEPEAAGEAAP